MLRIMIYEDSQSLRVALSNLISSSSRFILVGSFHDCKNCAQEVVVLRPDIVLMDIGLPEMNGIEGLKVIKQIRPETNVIMFTIFEDDERIFEALKYGAGGYLLKNTMPQKILDSILEITNGGAPISPTVAKKILDTIPKANKPEKNHADLTERESEILSLLSKGFSQKMVAQELDISINTVKTLIGRCYQKLNVHSITEAMSKVFGNDTKK